MNPMFLLRMARWARRPPSKRMVILIFSIVGLGIVIAVVEKYIGWPDFLTVNNFRR